MAAKKTHGTVIPAGNRWRARYAHKLQRHTPGQTFTTEEAAWQWLRSEQVLIDERRWTPPAERRAQEAKAKADEEAAQVVDSLTLDTYAREWIDQRRTRRGKPLAEKTKYEYLRYLEGRLSPLAALPVVEVDQATVKKWWAANEDAPTLRHHAYAVLSSVMTTALEDGLIDTNPCRVRHASARSAKRPKHEVEELIAGLSHLEVATLAEAMPPQHSALIPLLAYSGMRPGEALALTRSDIVTGTSSEGVPRWFVKVTEAVNLGKLGATKTPESVRTVPLPPHVAEPLTVHLEEHAQPGPKGLLFPSSHGGMDYATVKQVAGGTGQGKGGKLTGFNAAREAIGRPTLRLYDFRRWARYVWRLAGLSEYECERLLGHKLGTVTAAYFTFDLAQFWPHVDRISTDAGWVAPAPSRAAPSGPTDALAGIVGGMGVDQLVATLAALPQKQLAQVLPYVAPEHMAAVVSRLAGNRPSLRVLEGGV